jgi:hypothetical protein
MKTRKASEVVGNMNSQGPLAYSPQITRDTECVWGHSKRTIGCVSCVGLFGSGNPVSDAKPADGTRRSAAK